MTAYKLLSGNDVFAPPPPRAPDLVPDLIPSVGLILLAGRPSEGKSSMMRSIAFSISLGEPPLKIGHAQEPGDVLYVDFEGNHALAHAEQTRMFSENLPDLARLVYVYEPPRFPDLWRLLNDWRLKAERPRAVIIDVYSKSTPLRLPRGGRKLMQPEIDNLTLEPLKRWAEEHGLAVFILVHINAKKPIPASDPIGALGAVIGSSAIVGTPDCRMLLRRTLIGTSLFATGRALPSDRHVALDCDGGWFSVLGDVDTVTTADNETKILRALADAHAAMLAGHSQTDMMRGKEIADATGISYGSIRHKLIAMKNEGAINQPKYGFYSVAGKSRHTFTAKPKPEEKQQVETVNPSVNAAASDFQDHAVTVNHAKPIHTGFTAPFTVSNPSIEREIPDTVNSVNSPDVSMKFLRFLANHPQGISHTKTLHNLRNNLDASQVKKAKETLLKAGLIIETDNGYQITEAGSLKVNPQASLF
jgi:hypothetical protein